MQRKRRCHLQESKSGLYYIDTLMESGGWMLKDRPTDTHRPMMTKKTPEQPSVHRNSNAPPSRQPPTTDAASEQGQDIRPCACFPPEFIRHRIRNPADAKTVYEDPYSAECGTEVLKEIPQRLKGGEIKPVKDGSTAFECLQDIVIYRSFQIRCTHLYRRHLPLSNDMHPSGPRISEVSHRI